MHTKADLLCVKKALLLFFFALACLSDNTPSYSMTAALRRATRFPTQGQRAATTWRPGSRSIQTQPAPIQTQSPTAIQAQPTFPWRTKLADATLDFGSRLRAALSRYWYSESSILINTIRTSKIYNNPALWNEINNFLKKNTIDISEDVFKTLMQQDVSWIRPYLQSLQFAIKEDDEFAQKAILIIERFFQSGEKKIENVAYILSSIPNNLDPLKLEQLKQHFWSSINKSYWIIDWLEYGNNLTQLLPHDTKYFIEAIAHFCTVVDRTSDIINERTGTIQREFAYTITQKKLADTDLNELLLKLKATRYGTKINQDIELLLNPPSAYRQICSSNNLQVPSCHHLLKYFNRVQVLSRPTVFSDNFLRMLKSAIEKEAEVMDYYEIFYHGRRWEYGFLSDIFGILYSHKSGTKLKDFIFTHLDDPVIGNVSEKFFASERKQHAYLTQYGNPEYPSKIEYFFNRQRLLFLNKFLFGNLNNISSNSIDYIIQNYNQGDIYFSVKEIFSMFGYGSVYKKYKKKLLDLQQEYNSLSQHGELLQFLVPKNIVDKCVYYTTSGGSKLEYTLPDGTKTTDIKKILKNEDQNPHDKGEYVLINTHDLGLDPKSGIKIYSYNAVEPATWAAFQKKLEDFVPELEGALKEVDAQRQQEQIAKE